MGIEFRKILPNRGLLVSMLEKGYIRKQVHPTEPLTIFNYTEKATFDRVWNDATRMCRGLIINNDYEVVARPFPKFFNHNEPSAPVIDPDELVFVTDKIDGSLGIRYWQPNARKWAIATRGSFMSEQAIHATEKLDEMVRHVRSIVDDDYTQLYEIVYPGNRIVLDYGDLDGLIRLAYVENATGKVICDVSTSGATSFDLRSDGSTAFLGQMPLSEALALPDRPNAEGVVLITASSSKSQRMVKVKQSDYVAMHRTVSNLSTKVVWERMSNGEDLNSIKWGMPEELWDFIESTYNELREGYDNLVRAAKHTHSTILQYLDKVNGAYLWGRKEYAAMAVKFTYRDLLFLLLDERDISAVVWKKLKPEGVGEPYLRNNVSEES